MKAPGNFESEFSLRAQVKGGGGNEDLRVTLFCALGKQIKLHLPRIRSFGEGRILQESKGCLEDKNKGGKKEAVVTICTPLPDEPPTGLTAFAFG
jgi:hypothetical protein